MPAVRVVRTGAVGDITTEAELREQFARFSRLAREGHQVPDMSPADVEAELAYRRTVCDVSVVEFLELSDGRRISADCGLGYTTAFGLSPGADAPELPNPWAATTLDALRDGIQFVVEADADDLLEGAASDDDLSGYAAAAAVGVGDAWIRSRWARLVNAAAAEGVTVAPEELQAAPFEAGFTDRLLAERARHMP